MSVNPTGEQYTISHGDYSAVITEVGAGLRSLRHRDRELLHTFPADGAPPAYEGAQLLPWPNRIRDGRYTFEGVEHQLAISEPDRGTALHGLNHGVAWQLLERSPQRLTQRVTIYPQVGWPGVLVAEIAHALDEDGLTVEVTAANHGAENLPYGYAAHPYFAFTNIDQVRLHIPFQQRLDVDERLLPIALEPVEGAFDFTTPRALGGTEFDTAFASPHSTPWRVVMEGPSHTLGLWADATMGWLQIFTRPERDAMAVEPMTCGPDAFNPGPTRADRVVLAPSQSHTCRWGVRVESA